MVFITGGDPFHVVNAALIASTIDEVLPGYTTQLMGVMSTVVQLVLRAGFVNVSCG